MESTELIQRSYEWFEERSGKVTASNIHNIYDRTLQGKKTHKYNKYKWKIISDRLSPKREQRHFTNEAILWGIEHEEEARAEYEFRYNVAVQPCGFFNHPTINNAGASPDGLVGEDGLIEIKCPNSDTHLAFVLEDVINTDYLRQVHFQLACTNRQWCDFISYDPRFTDEFAHINMKVKRIHRDKNIIEEMNKRVIEFLDEVEDDISKILTLRHNMPIM